MHRFEGWTAAVTGAAHGIGRACAARLASEGALVAITDLDESAADEVATGLPGAPRHAAYAMDVTRSDEVQAVFAAIAERFGRLDLLVNVAGGDTAHGDFADTDDETWLRMLDLDLLGVVRCCRAALPYLRSSRVGPSIVTVTSINAHVALGREPYSSAKAGVASLTQNLAASLGPEGIRVNAVAPPRARSGPGTGTTSRAVPTGCGRCTSSAGSANPTTSRPPWPTWAPATRPGSPVRCCRWTVGCRWAPRVCSCAKPSADRPSAA